MKRKTRVAVVTKGYDGLHKTTSSIKSLPCPKYMKRKT